MPMTSEARASFRRCRRQWDFSAPTRQGYERVAPEAVLDLDRALRDALAVYYFPGMWDWSRDIVRPLVVEAFRKSVRQQRAACEPRGGQVGIDEARWLADSARGEAVLGSYMAWAPAFDRFAPIRVEGEFEALVPDPAEPERGLVDADRQAIKYAGRIDLLAIDADDRFWIARHRAVSGRWTGTQLLQLDDRDVADCWGWETCYLGVELAGTIVTEISMTAPTKPDEVSLSAGSTPLPPAHRVAQHDPSGGGRSFPQHQRADRQRAESPTEPPTVDLGDGFRRTWIPRSRNEIAGAGHLLGLEALDMAAPHLAIYPSPSVQQCPTCAFQVPCLAMSQGGDVAAALQRGYRKRPLERSGPPRLGAVTWSIGRGAAPPPRGQT